MTIELLYLLSRNVGDPESAISNAEMLQKIVPTSVVVKGLNTLSAYQLERKLHFGRSVNIFTIYVIIIQ